MTERANELPGLPAGWVWLRLEDCVHILDSRRVPVNRSERERRAAGKPRSELVPYYGATGRVGWIDGHLFDEDLVLLGEDGAPFLDPAGNKAYIINGRSWVNNHAHVLRAISEITSNSFICHYLNAFDYHDYVTGTTRLKLNQSRMRRMPVCLPSLPEQQRIVAKIEELFSQLDAGVAALEKAKAQFHRYRQAVLEAAMSGELTREWREAHKHELEPASVLLDRISKWKGTATTAMGKGWHLPVTSDVAKLPDAWAWAELGRICETTSGGTPSRKQPSYFGGHIPWLKSGELHDGPITHAEEHITEEGLNSSSAKLVRKGTLLVALYGATAGKLGILEIDAATNQAICAVTTPPGLDLKYLFWHLLHSRDDLLGARVGGAQPNISQRILRQLILAVPPFVEQQRIVAEIEQRVSLAEAADDTVRQSLRRSDRLRQSILKTAFGGRLVPQDPSDEPANVLLARIREKRARLKGDRKGGRAPEGGEMKRSQESRGLYEVLREADTQVAPEDLLDRAGFTTETIEEFYEELKRELARGRIRETRLEGTKVYLEVVPNEA